MLSFKLIQVRVFPRLWRTLSQVGPHGLLDELQSGEFRRYRGVSKEAEYQVPMFVVQGVVGVCM